MKTKTVIRILLSFSLTLNIGLLLLAALFCYHNHSHIYTTLPVAYENGYITDSNGNQWYTDFTGIPNNSLIWVTFDTQNTPENIDDIPVNYRKGN